MKLHHGDLFDVLPTLAEASIDACVTDPPYELGFMGRKWDSTGVAFDVETWLAVYRVLKPGGYVVAFGGTRGSHRMVCAIEDAGFEIRDSLCWLYGSGFPKSLNLGDGRGTALKPAHEPIVLAWKQFKGTITANVAEHGTGALNIDACRIGETKNVPASVSRKAQVNCYGKFKEYGEVQGVGGHDPNLGRWPANVLLDEAAAVALDEMTGELVSGANPTRRSSDKFRDAYGEFKGQEVCEPARGVDVGGASRFFYCAKPSRSERDSGMYGQESEYEHSGPRGHAANGDGTPRPRPRSNSHPTVKPVNLMRWLVRLVTPVGGTVLDPFLGSGTTGMACRLESRGFVGIEKEAEYFNIAEKRIASTSTLFDDVAETIAEDVRTSRSGLVMAREALNA